MKFILEIVCIDWST